MGLTCLPVLNLQGAGVIQVILVLVQQTGDNDSYAFVGELGVF